MFYYPRYSGFSAGFLHEGDTVNPASAPAYVPQDSLPVHRPDSLLPGDTALRISGESVMQLLEATRAREQEIALTRRTDSLKGRTQIKTAPVEEKVFIDSSKYILFDSLLTEYSPVSSLEKLSARDLRLQKGLWKIEGAPAESVFRQTGESGMTPVAGLVIREKKPVVHSALESSDWILGILIISLVLFAWIRVFFNKYLIPTFTGLFNYQQGNRLFRENNLLYQRFSLGMNTLFFITGALFLYFIHDFFSFNIPFLKGPGGLLFLSGGLLVIFTFRSLICRLTGFISNTRELFAEYSHTILMINKVLGIILLPVVFALPYIPDYLVPGFLYGGIGLFALSYLFRVYKGMQIFVLNRFSIFWMILYLCALEILLYLLIYTYFKSNVL